jgi:L-lactate permease
VLVYLNVDPISIIGQILFAGTQAISANLVGPELPDLTTGLISLLGLIVVQSCPPLSALNTKLPSMPYVSGRLY